LLLSFGMMAVNIPQAYVISKNILDKNHNMKSHLVNGLKFSFLYYLLLLLLYFFIGIQLVETFFGKNLIAYMNLFYTMTVGQLFYVLIGPMGQILILSKKYKNALKSLTLSLILCIILTVILIFNYGFNGACYSYVINLLIVHSNFAFFAYKELKIRPSIYYILFKSNEKSS
jgi:O-antigen/teichoic acid export membrane protein